MTEYTARVSVGHVASFVSLELDRDITTLEMADLGFRCVGMLDDALRSDEVREFFGLDVSDDSSDVPDTVAGIEPPAGDDSDK